MHCEKCVEKVVKAIKAVGGSAIVDLATGKAKVTCPEAIDVNPVSYTHLDVYKRQCRGCIQQLRRSFLSLFQKRIRDGAFRLIAVSYTHLGNIVHSYRYSAAGAECAEVCADMTVADRAVICAPIVHDIVGACKRALSGKTRSKPCAGPCIVLSLIHI